MNRTIFCSLMATAWLIFALIAIDRTAIFWSCIVLLNMWAAASLIMSKPND